MSLDATRWAWEQADIKATEKLVLLSLADRADEYHSCYPSIARLCSDTCLDRKTILGAINSLESAGLISVDRRFGAANKYDLIGVTGRHQTSTKHGTGSRKKTSTETGTGCAEELVPKTVLVADSEPVPDSEHLLKQPVPKTGLEPVPKTVHESTNESKTNTSLPFGIGTDDEKSEPKKPRRKTQLPNPFLLTAERRRSAMEFWTRKLRTDLNVIDEFQQFVDHHRARGSTMADWDAAWRTWYSNAVRFSRPFAPFGASHATSPRPARQTPADRIRSQAASVLADEFDRETGGPTLDADGRSVRREVDRQVR